MTPEDIIASYGLWTMVLTEYVDARGLVDYAALAQDIRFQDVLHRFAVIDAEQLANDDAKRAFWINAYNALVLYGVTLVLPADRDAWPDFDVSTVKVDDRGFFNGLRFHVGGQRLILEDIERALLLHYPDYWGENIDLYDKIAPASADPRVHFALTRASIGSPLLRREAYLPERIGEQLADAARTFAADASRCRFDAQERVLFVSQIMEDWTRDLTGKHFRPRARTIPALFAEYVAPAELAKSLREDDWHIRYIAYDRRLNAQPSGE